MIRRNGKKGSGVGGLGSKKRCMNLEGVWQMELTQHGYSVQ